MKAEVRYYTKSGNMKKIAEAIARAIGVTAQDVSVPLEEKTDVLFLCNAMYAAGVDPAVKAFIEENRTKIVAIYNVSTTAIAPSTHRMVEKIAKENGVTMAKEEFFCRGAFAFLHRGRPNETDLRDAAAFAKRICGRT